MAWKKNPADIMFLQQMPEVEQLKMLNIKPVFRRSLPEI
jgi:hypothetical protein